MFYEYICEQCGRRWEEQKTVKDRYNVFCCGERAVKLLSQDVVVYDDTTHTKVFGNFGNRPIEVTGRRHYKKLLKEHGLVDTTINDLKTMKPKNKGLDTKALSNEIRKRCQEDGVAEHLGGFTEKLKNNDLRVKDIDYKPIKMK